ncbi:MAG: energy transducer TonB [Candidatus Acidiferrum sp.]
MIEAVIETTMRQLSLLFSIILGAFAALTLFGRSSTAPDSNPLQSFFIARHFFSDDLPEGYDEILAVTPQGKDVCVRVIRISLANPYCGGSLVRAAERVFPNTTVRKVTGRVDLCSFTEPQVEAALKAAAPKGISDNSDSATLDVVAHCGAQERVFEFPYPAEIDDKALDRNTPRVSALWGLNYEVRSRAFGKSFSFYNLSPDKEKEFEDIGTKLLPELVSGNFEAGFGGYTCGNQKCDTNYLAWLLKGYTKAPSNRDPSTVELVNATALHLVHYDLPLYPALARQARLSGEVRLKISVDAQTDLVKDVQQTSGNTLLGKAAIDSAKKWQFSPGSQRGQPVEAVLKFTLCPGEG